MLGAMIYEFLTSLVGYVTSMGLASYRFEPTGHVLELSSDADSDNSEESPVHPASHLGNMSWCFRGGCSNF